jgi:hypothetical protein
MHSRLLLYTHEKYYSCFSRVNYTSITSSDSQYISRSLCESLKIFGFPKYSIYGVTVHKKHFFFPWIDLYYLYEIKII